MAKDTGILDGEADLKNQAAAHHGSQSRQRIEAVLRGVIGLNLSRETDMAEEARSKKEVPCGKIHWKIEEAIHCARTSLGAKEDIEPYWGTMGIINPGHVVGYQVSARKRWRLDYDPDKGIHVNEENYDALPSRQKIVHYVKTNRFDATTGKGIWSEELVRTYWRKWTTRYGTPGRGILCPSCKIWHITGRCL